MEFGDKVDYYVICANIGILATLALFRVSSAITSSELWIGIDESRTLQKADELWQ